MVIQSLLLYKRASIFHFSLDTMKLQGLIPLGLALGNLLDERKKFESNIRVCNGVKVVDKMNGENELSFACKPNNKRFRSKCRGNL